MGELVMATQPLRRRKSVRARSKRPTITLRPLCSQLEERIAPALFTVKSPITISGSRNFGCVATGDFNGDGKTDIVMTNYGSAGPGNNAGGNTMSVALGNAD